MTEYALLQHGIVFNKNIFNPAVFATSGDAIPFVRLSHQERLSAELPIAEIEFAEKGDLTHGDELRIYRDNTLLFKGKVRGIEDDSDTKRQVLHLRHVAEKGLRRLTGRRLFETEPAWVVKQLNQPILDEYKNPVLDIDSFSTDTLASKWETLEGSFVWNAGTQDIKLGTVGVNIIVTKKAGADNWTDYVVEVDTKSTSSWRYNGILFRIQDSTHAYVLVWRYSGSINRLQLFRLQGENELSNYNDRGGGIVWLDGYAALTASPNVYHNIKVEVEGSTIKCYFDNVLKITVADSTYASGKAGIYSEAGSVDSFFDNFRVVGVGQETESSWVTSGDPGSGTDYAVDFDEGTYWESSDPQAEDDYWKVDMGEIKSDVGAILLVNQATAYPQNFKIEVSTDDAEYTEVFSRTSNTVRNILATFSPRDVRYIKITLTDDGDQVWYLGEVQIFETEAQLFAIGTVDEYGAALGFRFDYVKVWAALQSIANRLGWDLYVDNDLTIYFVSARGTDKSATIKFEKGVNMPNLRKISDSTGEIDRAWALGQGDWIDQLTAKSDVDPLPDDYAEDAFNFKDIVDAGLLQKAADRMLDLYKDPVDSYEAHVIDTYSTGAWGLGDSVKITDAYLGLDDALRVVAVERSYSQNAEDVTIILGRLPTDLDVELRRFDALLEVLNAAAQALGARTTA